MGLHKQFLLASAAVLGVTAAAQAADLPSRKAAPVQYVRVCDVYGAGFFYIPGTDTCLRVGGYVRAEYDYTPGQRIINAKNGAVSQIASAQDETGMEMRGRIDVDARTQTSYGTVQTVVHLRGTNVDGLRNASSVGPVNFALSYPHEGNGSPQTFIMERAFIRFAGFTAGVSTENFTTMPPYMYSGNVYVGFPNGIKQLTYTAIFGGGLSATASIESAADWAHDAPPGAGGGAVAPSAVPTIVGSQYVNQWDTGYVLVGNVRDDQSWGYVQLSGLVTNDTTIERNAAGIYENTYDPSLGPQRYGAYGLAFSFEYKLPMIAPGDQFHFQAAYGHGWLGAVFGTGGLSNLSGPANKRVLGGVQRQDSNLVPTFVNAAGGVTAYGLNEDWGVYGLFTHYWAPTWRSNVAIGYGEINPPTAHCTSATGVVGFCTNSAGLNTQWGRGDIFQVAGNLIWSPTRNFDIGLDVEYLRLTSVLQNPSAAFIAAGEPGLTEDNITTHLRIQRTF